MRGRLGSMTEIQMQHSVVYLSIDKSNSAKLTIRTLPLSVSNKEIEKLLFDKKNVKLRSPIKYRCICDENGQLTSYKNEDRFLYVEPYNTPLPKQHETGQFKRLLIHHAKPVMYWVTELGQTFAKQSQKTSYMPLEDITILC